MSTQLAGDLLHQWMQDHRARWKPRAAPHANAVFSEDILGNKDAKAEWRADEKPVYLFTHTASYKQFKEPRSLFLFGRRGTGKTTLIRMLDHEVKTGQNQTYSVAWVADTHNLLLGLSGALSGTVLEQLDVPKLTSAIEPIWRWVIHLSAMFALLEGSQNSAAEPPELKLFRSYLNALLPEDWPLNPRTALRHAMQRRVAEAVAGQETPAGIIARLADAFSRPEHTVILNSLRGALRKRPCVILLDSGEVYQVRESITNAAVSAILGTCYFFSTDWSGNRLYAKAAFPSEILPHVFQYNRAKFQDRIVLITWAYKDLVTFLAKRFRHAIGPTPTDEQYEELGDFHTALTFLYEHLPEHVETKVGIPFDTIAYLLRHTQKTPRQVMIILNAVLTRAKAAGLPLEDLKRAPETIVEGLHLEIHQLPPDAIQMHEMMYPNAQNLVKRVLSGQRAYFEAGLLDTLIKEVSDLRRGDDLERVDVKRILFETGALGLAQAAHALEDNAHWLLEGTFEYQLKDTLPVARHSVCMIHPMFHEWLQTFVDQTTFTYPLPYEDEEHAVLARFGVRSIHR